MSEAYTVVPLTPLRKIIAARMAEATRTIPHYRAGIDIEIDALIKLRSELKAQSPVATLSLNDLLIKACAAALMDTPAVNIQWVDNAIHQYRSADISIVTAIEGGLATPIVRNADTKSVWEISSEVKALNARAACGKLKMGEILGGSFSISNLGMFGVDEFDAIINPPQCAILGVGAARSRIVASEDKEFRSAMVVRVTLSADHRAIDGAVSAGFLSALRKRIEQPEHMRPQGAG
jgi:pyruvate dehydrogenase E2 component (dihydrolipoamide acetyltransferase)